MFSGTDPFAGVDLDDCIDRATSQPKPWAREILDQLDSYSEISPSANGVKIFVRSSKPGRRCKTRYGDGALEMYDHARFFTVTGERLPETPEDVEPRQAALDGVYARVFGGTGAPAVRQVGLSGNGQADLSDDEIIRLATTNRRSGARFDALWAGQWREHFNSWSEADASVVFTLAYYTKDAGRIDRLFRHSGLMREKWDERRGELTYGKLTIAKALSEVRRQYRPKPNCNAEPAVDAPEGNGGGGGELVPLGARDPATNRLVLSAKKTLPTAEAFVREFHDHRDGRTLLSYASTLLVWRDNRYAEIEEETLKQKLQPWLHAALEYVVNRRSGFPELVDFKSNPTTINAAVASIRAHVHLPTSVTPPVWLSSTDQRPDPREVLPCLSGNLHVPTRTMLPPTPALFNLNALDFDYEPAAAPPERWTRFLEQLWGDDAESVALLQEWMGYSLVADTSQQKMLLIVGPRRSGKGTIGRVLGRLVGVGNVVGPTTSSLAGTFGLQSLIGKSLAIVSDARFTGEGVGVVVERLLCISGEDALTVDRKFLPCLTTRLSTRFMFLANELPRLKDASAALAGRFVVLRLTRSFYGEEDVTLTERLLEERPGILLWAIAGLERLRVRGYFVQPASVSDAVRDLEDLASPVLAFVRDRCIVGAGHRLPVDCLYNAWTRWCRRGGRTAVTNKQMFGRDLAAAVAGVICRRSTGDHRFYDGISLRESKR